MKAWACFKKERGSFKAALRDGDTVYVEPTRKLARERSVDTEKIVRVEISEVK